MKTTVTATQPTDVQSPLVRFFNNLTARGLAAFLAFSLLLSIATTWAFQTFGDDKMRETFKWDVYLYFFGKVVTRAPLVFIVMTIYGVLILGVQGLVSLKVIRDSDQTWVANSLGFATVAAILFVGSIG